MANEEEAITYTTAPEDYDWFGTRTVEIAGTYLGTNNKQKPVRKVTGPKFRVEAQRDRYASGLHLAVDEKEWRKLLAFNLATKA